MAVVKLNKMDLSCLAFKEPIINPFTKMQHICKIAYDDDFLNLQTNNMYQNQHDGIPYRASGVSQRVRRIGDSTGFIFHNEDERLMKLLLQIDSLASTLTNKVMTNKEKYQYIPTVKRFDERRL